MRHDSTGFKSFCLLTLLQQALPAIISQALRRLRGAVLVRSSPFVKLRFPVLASEASCALNRTRILRAVYLGRYADHKRSSAIKIGGHTKDSVLAHPCQRKKILVYKHTLKTKTIHKIPSGIF